MTDQEVIKEEIELILEDIIKVYEASGRKVSGQFAEGLEAIYEPYKATIRGFVYLAGRGKTKNKGKAGEPTVQQRILVWLKQRGIRPIKENMTLKSLSFAIAKKIHEQGTNKSNWLKIYEQVITPERIDKIIDRISELNVNRIITEIRAELEVLAKNV